MPTATTTIINELKDALAIGLGVVTRVWEYKTKDWVTSVYVADIDNDGSGEVITCSRDGRVHLLTAGKGESKWERVVGEKAWVGSGVIIKFIVGELVDLTRIFVGTRDGKLFALDKDGRTITKDGGALPFGSDGKSLDPDAENEASWLNTGNPIRQIYVNLEKPSSIIIGSEDRSAYELDSRTGEQRWKFPTNGWVRSVFSCDIDSDGKAEILIGSLDRHLYVLDSRGQQLAKYLMHKPPHTIYASDIDADGRVEILVGTDGKDLVALTYDITEGFQEKWHHRFGNRLLSLCATDIDGDGQHEIIAGSEDKHFYILDAQGNLIWRHNHKQRVFSICPYDIDNDGVPELLIGSDNNVVRAMRIRLRRDLEKKIRKNYQVLGKSAPSPSSIAGLTANERALLQDILSKDIREHVTLKQATDLMDTGKYKEALAILLRLEQQKAQPLWTGDKVGLIRSACLRHISGDHKREIIVGSSEGDVYAFNAHGMQMWSTHFDDRIVDVQTGYIDHHRQEEIVICSSGRRIHIVKGTKPRELRDAYIDTLMSSICVTSPNRQSPAEIVIGSEENKLLIYGSDLQRPTATIETKEGIRVVRTQTPGQEHSPEIIAAGLGHTIYAYTRQGEQLWTFETHDHIRAIRLKDINGDGRAEVLIGSEDRCIHVLDDKGHLIWRYFLPHSALSVDAMDADQDGMIEIFVGCADGFLYVFNREGDLKWTYQAHDRIHALHVEDINDDDNVEIVLGSEDELEVIQIVNPHKIATLIDQCWSTLCKQHPPQAAIDDFLKGPDPNPLLQAFALNKLTEQKQFSSDSFDLFERFAREGDVEVRKSLVQLAIAHYKSSPERARSILQILSIDPDPDVRTTFIDHMPQLIKHGWETGSLYLKRFSENDDRFVRRLVMRKLYELIDMQIEGPTNKNRQVFEILLAGMQFKESEWVRQEAARTLAHFLSRHQGRLITDVHLFIVKDIKPSILRQIAFAATSPVVSQYISATASLLTDLNDGNVLEKTLQVIKALENATSLIYGKDVFLIYTELSHLLALRSIEEIAQYQSPFDENSFTPGNDFARIILTIFEKIGSITRALRIYMRRESIYDRLSSLLEANDAIERTHKFLELQYKIPLMGEPITKLANHQVFLLLLNRWNEMVTARRNELRGTAELTAELQTRQARLDEQVAIWVRVQNSGRGSASNVRVTLLHNNNAPVVGKHSFEFEVIASQEVKTVEFILSPKTPVVELHFEIVYDDAEDTMKTVEAFDRLALNESFKEFRYIPNLYSTGTPTHDSKMFYGREEAVNYLRDNLTRNAKSVIVLYGQRRSGKTTLLIQLINTGALGKHIPVLIDMQRLSYNINIQNFLYKVAYSIYQATKRQKVSLCQPEPENFEADPTHAFDVFLDNAEEQLQGRKLILLIDEFEVLEEQVVKNKLAPEIFEYLRDIVQHRPDMHYLFSGTHKITEHTKWYRSVFFNIALHYRLSRLSAQGAEALIQQPVADYLEYEPLTVTKIRQLTADQPYLIHLMCRTIVDYCNDRRKTYVTINDVNIVLREVMQTGQYHLDWLLDQVKPEERVALSVLAEGGKEEGRWLTLFEIEEIYRQNHIPFKHERLQASLKSLLEADIIESISSDFHSEVFDHSRFRIPVGLTRGWLLRERPLEKVRKELTD